MLGEGFGEGKERPPDLAWEALVAATAANPDMERGALNKSLAAIRKAARSEGLTEDGIPNEIRLRAAAYQRAFPHAALTPTALAKHWFRVMVDPPPTPPTAKQRQIEEMRRRTR